MEQLESLLDLRAPATSVGEDTGIIASIHVHVLIIPDHMPFVTALIASAKENQEDACDAPKLPFRLQPSVG